MRSVRSGEGRRALFLRTGAYWLLHSLRMAVPRRSRWCGATFATIRDVFVKIAVRVEELKRSIKLAYPCHVPNADVFALITRRLTAQGP
jgi:Transposase DDE domain group 1